MGAEALNPVSKLPLYHQLYELLERVYIGHHIPADIYYSRNLRPVKR